VDEALQAWAGRPLPTWTTPVDSALADVGSDIFQRRCSVCHALTAESQIGPDLAGVTHRHTPLWMQAMILSPDSMVENDPQAMALKAGYEVQMMVPGGMDTLRTRAVIEFLRRDGGRRLVTGTSSPGRWRVSRGRLPQLPRVPTMLPLLVCLLTVLPLSTGCRDLTVPATVPTADGPMGILFLGNSLTLANDLPGAVATVAEARGIEVRTATAAYPNFSLEDHFKAGIPDVILQSPPDIVVMQQGPSSLPESQVHLAMWADSLSRVIKGVGAEPALLMVWPPQSRASAFDDVRDSYRNAALRVDGTFIPAGEALRALQEGHPELSPFSADGFHPSERGTVLAAYVIVGTLLERASTGLPAMLPAADPDGRVIDLDAETAAILQATADSVVAAWR
jgi:hypothetical protein